MKTTELFHVWIKVSHSFYPSVVAQWLICSFLCWWVKCCLVNLVLVKRNLFIVDSVVAFLFYFCSHAYSTQAGLHSAMAGSGGNLHRKCKSSFLHIFFRSSWHPLWVRLRGTDVLFLQHFQYLLWPVSLCSWTTLSQILQKASFLRTLKVNLMKKKKCFQLFCETFFWSINLNVPRW